MKCIHVLFVLFIISRLFDSLSSGLSPLAITPVFANPVHHKRGLPSINQSPKNSRLRIENQNELPSLSFPTPTGLLSVPSPVFPEPHQGAPVFNFGVAIQEEYANALFRKEKAYLDLPDSEKQDPTQDRQQVQTLHSILELTDLNGDPLVRGELRRLKLLNLVETYKKLIDRPSSDKNVYLKDLQGMLTVLNFILGGFPDHSSNALDLPQVVRLFRLRSIVQFGMAFLLVERQLFLEKSLADMTRALEMKDSQGNYFILNAGRAESLAHQAKVLISLVPFKSNSPEVTQDYLSVESILASPEITALSTRFYPVLCKEAADLKAEASFQLARRGNNTQQRYVQLRESIIAQLSADNVDSSGPNSDLDHLLELVFKIRKINQLKMLIEVLLTLADASEENEANAYLCESIEYSDQLVTFSNTPAVSKIDAVAWREALFLRAKCYEQFIRMRSGVLSKDFLVALYEKLLADLNVLLQFKNGSDSSQVTYLSQRITCLSFRANANMTLGFLGIFPAFRYLNAIGDFTTILNEVNDQEQNLVFKNSTQLSRGLTYFSMGLFNPNFQLFYTNAIDDFSAYINFYSQEVNPSIHITRKIKMASDFMAAAKLYRVGKKSDSIVVPSLNSSGAAIFGEMFSMLQTQNFNLSDRNDRLERLLADEQQRSIQLEMMCKQQKKDSDQLKGVCRQFEAEIDGLKSSFARVISRLDAGQASVATSNSASGSTSASTFGSESRSGSSFPAHPHSHFVFNPSSSSSSTANPNFSSSSSSVPHMTVSLAPFLVGNSEQNGDSDLLHLFSTPSRPSLPAVASSKDEAKSSVLSSFSPARVKQEKLDEMEDYLDFLKRMSAEQIESAARVIRGGGSAPQNCCRLTNGILEYFLTSQTPKIAASSARCTVEDIKTIMFSRASLESASHSMTEFSNAFSLSSSSSSSPSSSSSNSLSGLSRHEPWLLKLQDNGIFEPIVSPVERSTGTRGRDGISSRLIIDRKKPGNSFLQGLQLPTCCRG